MQSGEPDSDERLLLQWRGQNNLTDYFRVTYEEAVTNLAHFSGVTVFTALFIFTAWQVLHTYNHQSPYKFAFGLIAAGFAALGTIVVIVWLVHFLILPLGPRVLARRLDPSVHESGWSLAVGKEGLTVSEGTRSQSLKWEEITQASIRKVRDKGMGMNFYSWVMCVRLPSAPDRDSEWPPLPAGWPSRNVRTLDARKQDDYVPLCVLGPMARAQLKALEAALIEYAGQYWWPADGWPGLLGEHSAAPAAS